MEERFLELFNLYKNDIYRFIYSYTKNLYDADDILQSVFIKLCKHQNLFNKSNDEIKKWLIKVSINECKNLFLSFWRKNVSFDYNDNISYSNQNDNIMPFILKLPTKYRTIIFLYYYEGYKIDEIAHILNLSSTNIQTILYRAREKLKEMLKED
ncbi:sigma-70 region 2 [Firmicutes bacterium CAG:884]|nr:sigma-70 region 2 [Firmicutes bacterium CAG:884]